MTVKSDGSLNILSVQLEDEGVYQCVATNVAGNSSHTLHVTVQGKSLVVIIIMVSSLLWYCLVDCRQIDLSKLIQIEPRSGLEIGPFCTKKKRSNI